ncbi:MAG: TonB-dependent receptor plug domain-containing protein [Solirubrobacterales bacterium]
MARKILTTAILVFCLGASVQADSGDSPAADPNDPSQAGLFDMSIEELMDVRIDTVYGASKRTQSLAEAPASVTVVTAEEIHRYGYRTLAEVLKSVPGFYINYDRNYDYVGTRGFRRPGDYDSRILLLIDGHRANENVGDAPMFGTEFPLDVDLIEKVEVIRGPGSALYGSNAVLAVVNVVTKAGAAFQGLELSGHAGSFDTQSGRVTYGNRFQNNLDLLVSGTTYNSEGSELYFKEFDSPDSFNGLVRNDDDQFDNFVTRASWGDFSFLLAHNEREKGIPTAAWDTVFGDSRTRNSDDTTLVGLTYAHELSERYAVRARIAYNHHSYNGQYVYDYAEEGEEPDIVLNRDYWKSRYWEGELQLIGSPITGHTFTGGFEGRINLRQDQASWDEEEVFLDDSRDSDNWGVYIQDEFKPFEKLTIVGGLRYSEYNICDDSVNPRLALIYDLLENTVLKLLYGSAFRAPNAYELYYHDGNYTQKAAGQLDPESISTYEVVLERQLNRVFRATAGGFYYDMEDLIDQYTDPADGLLVFRNLGEVDATGLELTLQGRWESGWQSRASYSYVQSRDVAADETLVDSPKHLAKLNLMAPVVPERLFAGLEVQYDSKAGTLGGNHTDSVVLTNLTMTYTNASKRMEIQASVYNLFDVEYGYPGFGEHTQDEIEQDGRTFRVGLTYRF